MLARHASPDKSDHLTTVHRQVVTVNGTGLEFGEGSQGTHNTIIYRQCCLFNL